MELYNCGIYISVGAIVFLFTILQCCIIKLLADISDKIK